VTLKFELRKTSNDWNHRYLWYCLVEESYALSILYPLLLSHYPIVTTRKREKKNRLLQCIIRRWWWRCLFCPRPTNRVGFSVSSTWIYYPDTGLTSICSIMFSRQAGNIKCTIFALNCIKYSLSPFIISLSDRNYKKAREKKQIITMYHK
jgi:hypothetical protein